MTTRRQVNTAVGLALTGYFSGRGSDLLRGQTSNTPGPAVNTLMHEPLGDITNPEVSVLTLTVAPGTVSTPHKHPGPVFAYILEGEIENQVDPDQPKTYRVGDYFYEPAMHVHRSLRNLSKTETAKLLIFQVGEKGKPGAIKAE